jgi:hypothetical protein
MRSRDRGERLEGCLRDGISVGAIEAIFEL